MNSLPDTAVACIVEELSAGEWGRLMCVNRSLREQLLRVLASHPLQVQVDCSARSFRAALQAVVRWCRSISSLSLHEGSARSLHGFQLLQPLLQPQLTHLSLHGLKLNQGDCHARRLVSLLQQHCPSLQHLDLQGCKLPHLGTFQPLLLQRTQPQQAPQPGSRPPHLRVLQLTGARLYPSAQPWGSERPQCSSAVREGSEEVAAAGLQELHLGCRCDQVDVDWLHSNAAVANRDVLELMGGRVQALKVLDVCKRPAINDDLMRDLAAQCPSTLDTLDISLTRVTPAGLLQLLPRCPQLRVLRYACWSGDEGLDTQLMARMAAALPALQELDLSLHPQLRDAGLAALKQCQRLRKLKLARSHRFTGAGLEQLVAALPELQELVVVRCSGVRQASLDRLAVSRRSLQVQT